MIADLHAASVLPLVGERRPAGAPGHVVVEGPGGTGKSALLAGVADSYRAAGLAVVDLGACPAPNVVAGRFAVVVDDAQRLPGAALHRVRALADDAGALVAVAFRPWPRPPALTELVHALGSERRSVSLGHVDRGTVQG